MQAHSTFRASGASTSQQLGAASVSALTPVETRVCGASLPAVQERVVPICWNHKKTSLPSCGFSSGHLACTGKNAFRQSDCDGPTAGSQPVGTCRGSCRRKPSQLDARLSFFSLPENFLEKKCLGQIGTKWMKRAKNSQQRS